MSVLRDLSRIYSVRRVTIGSVFSMCFVGAISFGTAGSGRAEPAVTIPSAEILENVPADATAEKAVFAGGCFWGVQGVFQHVKGVKNAVSGYAGGKQSTARYEIVSTGQTGHAESVEVTFDPHVVNYATLLQVYFSVVHDPTELNRQGPDIGTQYRSAIFTENAEQAEVAKAYIAQLGKAGAYGKKPIVTTVGPLEGFYPAEDYHQDYATLHPTQPYIAYNDLPKINNLGKLFPALYNPRPNLVRQSALTE